MAEKPNVIIFFTDQQRYDTIAALGNEIIRTPVLDRLVSRGTAFERCYTPTPVCVAARCSLMTGRPPHQTGCFDNDAMPQDLPTIAFPTRSRSPFASAADGLPSRCAPRSTQARRTLGGLPSSAATPPRESLRGPFARCRFPC